MQVDRPKKVQSQVTAVVLSGEQNSKASQTPAPAYKCNSAEYTAKSRSKISRNMTRFPVGLEPMPNRHMAKEVRLYQLCYCCADGKCVLKLDKHDREESCTTGPHYVTIKQLEMPTSDKIKVNRAYNKPRPILTNTSLTETVPGPKGWTQDT